MPPDPDAERRRGDRGHRRRGVLYVFLSAGAMLAVLGAFIFLSQPGTTRGQAQAQIPRPAAPPSAPAPFTPYEGSEAMHRRLDVADLVAVFPDHVIRYGATDRRTVALTFDDGPDDRYTPAVLDILAEQQVPGTFFINGVRAQHNADVLRRIVKEGHALASHGWAHARYSALTEDAIRADLNRNKALIKELGGDTGLFRPPYGALDMLAARVVIDQGYEIVLWSIDTRDWMSRSADEIIETVLDEIRPGAIILQHSAGGGDMDLSGSIEALPIIIRELRTLGYRFVTVPELMGRAPASPAAGQAP
ncbi:MAG TPA: polysaccharide deacetylase family protein [Bacillota bacterium]